MKCVLLVGAVFGLALAFAGCGQSAQDKAKDDVCEARADIQKRVTDLQQITLSAATADQVKSDLTAITDDLKKISDAQGDLDETRKEQVRQANETFKSEVNALTQDIGSGKSVQDLATQLKSGIAGLANAYKSALAPIDCG